MDAKRISGPQANRTPTWFAAPADIWEWSRSVMGLSFETVEMREGAHSAAPAARVQSWEIEGINRNLPEYLMARLRKDKTAEGQAAFRELEFAFGKASGTSLTIDREISRAAAEEVRFLIDQLLSNHPELQAKVSKVLDAVADRTSAQVAKAAQRVIQEFFDRQEQAVRKEIKTALNKTYSGSLQEQTRAMGQAVTTAVNYQQDVPKEMTEMFGWADSKYGAGRPEDLKIVVNNLLEFAAVTRSTKFWLFLHNIADFFKKENESACRAVLLALPRALVELLHEVWNGVRKTGYIGAGVVGGAVGCLAAVVIGIGYPIKAGGQYHALLRQTHPNWDKLSKARVGISVALATVGGTFLAWTIGHFTRAAAGAESGKLQGRAILWRAGRTVERLVSHVPGAGALHNAAQDFSHWLYGEYSGQAGWSNAK